MATLKIGEFQLIDHGIDGSQYFQGCGTAFTPYAHVATGCGDNPREALDDLLEMVAQYAVPNGKPTMIERDGQQFVNGDAYDDFDTSDLRERIIKSEEGNDALVKNEDGTFDFPEEPSAYHDMLSANGFDEEPEEPDRDDFESDEDYEEAMEEYESRSKEYEELSGECDMHYYMSLRWNPGVDWTAIYEGGVCPDCQEPIPAETPDGGDCENCGHVFHTETDPDDVDPENHEHVWGPVEHARFTGNPHRKCQVPGCKHINMDLEDEDEPDAEHA